MLARTINTIFIERVANGGFIIYDQPPSHGIPGKLAAMTSLDEALTFIRTDVWPDRPVAKEAGASDACFSDFTPWDGGHVYPGNLQGLTRVAVLLRSGAIVHSFASDLNWERHDGDPIVGYKVEP